MAHVPVGEVHVREETHEEVDSLLLVSPRLGGRRFPILVPTSSLVSLPGVGLAGAGGHYVRPWSVRTVSLPTQGPGRSESGWGRRMNDTLEVGYCWILSQRCRHFTRTLSIEYPIPLLRHFIPCVLRIVPRSWIHGVSTVGDRHDNNNHDTNVSTQRKSLEV